MGAKKKITFQKKVFRIASSVESKCGASLFWNKGTSRALLNDMPLEPNEFIVLDGNLDEEDVTVYEVGFDTSIGAVNQLFVWQKIYA